MKLLPIAFAGAVSLVQAEIVDVKWDAGGRFERRLEIPGGKFVELCEKLAPGAKVRWRFDAPATLNFNVHYHAGKDVRYPARQDGVQRGQGTLDVTSAHDYCWMWTNKGPAAVSLNVQLARE